MNYQQHITYEVIGTIDMGIDGRDEYIKIECDVPINREALKQAADSHFSYTCNSPGQMFCHYVLIYYSEIDAYSAIVVVPHRYDN